jgi:hypothetical protein
MPAMTPAEKQRAYRHRRRTGDPSLLERGRPRVIWTAEMVACLIAMRDRPWPSSIADCAKRIGVADATARKKAQELGLTRRSYGAQPGLGWMLRDPRGRYAPGDD